jgi:hypothetical protein
VLACLVSLIDVAQHVRRIVELIVVVIRDERLICPEKGKEKKRTPPSR